MTDDPRIRLVRSVQIVTETGTERWMGTTTRMKVLVKNLHYERDLRQLYIDF